MYIMIIYHKTFLQYLEILNVFSNISTNSNIFSETTVGLRHVPYQALFIIAHTSKIPVKF